MSGPPTTYASLKRAVGFAIEVTPGTPVAPTAWLAVDKFDWNDKPTWLKDQGLRGVMANDAFNLIQGVGIAEIDMSGPVFGDEVGYLMGNLFGHDDTTGASAPYLHKFSLLNSLTGQATTHTISQFYGPGSTNCRQFAGACFSEFTLTWNAESEMLAYSAKATAWMSNTAASAPTPTFTATKPNAAWMSTLGVGGTVSGSPVLTVYKGTFGWKRQVKPYFTAQNLQNPYIIQRGGLSGDFALTFVAADESPLTAMRNNTQPQIQYILNNGLSGASEIITQVDIQQGAYTEAKPSFGAEAIEWEVAGTQVLNTTNVGTGGGYGPSTISMSNAVPASTYVTT